MKKSLSYLVIILFVVFISACDSNDSGTNEPTDGSSAAQYYPGAVGTTYKYQGQVTDSTGSSSTYTRDANYTSQMTMNGNTYIVQSNVITAGTGNTTGEFLFRTSTTGLFVYVDASGLESLLDSVDTGGIQLDITADPEVKMISYPFDSSPEWDAFNVDVGAYNGLISLNILSLKGYYRGQESVTVMNQNMTAEKVEYIATIKIPESIEDIANPRSITVSAYAWFVKDIGLVKLDGSEILTGAFTGGDLMLDGDGSITEVLASYNIQQ